MAPVSNMHKPLVARSNNYLYNIIPKQSIKTKPLTELDEQISYLPNELIEEIILYIPDIKYIIAFAKTCTRFYHIFNSIRHKITPKPIKAIKKIYVRVLY